MRSPPGANRSTVDDGSGVLKQFRWNLDIAGQIGHILLWLLLTIVTLGLGYPFYLYKVWGLAVRHSEV